MDTIQRLLKKWSNILQKFSWPRTFLSWN